MRVTTGAVITQPGFKSCPEDRDAATVVATGLRFRGFAGLATNMICRAGARRRKTVRDTPMSVSATAVFFANLRGFNRFVRQPCSAVSTASARPPRHWSDVRGLHPFGQFIRLGLFESAATDSRRALTLHGIIAAYNEQMLIRHLNRCCGISLALLFVI